MMFPMKVMAVLVVVASLALGSSQVGCAGPEEKLSSEWQFVDNFANDGLQLDRINKYLEENQATLEPKLRDAFELVKEALELNSNEVECSESKSQVVARLFGALNIRMSAKSEPNAKGIRQLAFETRSKYGDACSLKYGEQLEKQIKENLDTQVRMTVQEFGAQYAIGRDMEKEDLFHPLAEVRLTNLVTAGLMGRSLFAGVKGWMSGYKKQLNPATGKEEYNWLEMVEGVRDGCKAYKAQVKDLLELVSKDAVVSGAFAQLANWWQIWSSWTATLACDRLEKFEVEKLAKKLALSASLRG